MLESGNEAFYSADEAEPSNDSDGSMSVDSDKCDDLSDDAMDVDVVNIHP